MIKPTRQSQEGIVIIVALFIVALVSSLSYLMIARFERDTRRSAMILRNVQAEYYAQGSVAWAMDVLRNNIANHKKGQLVDKMPLISPVNHVGEYAIASVVYDMQGRYNINNLDNDGYKLSDIIDFLRIIMPDLEEAQLKTIYDGIHDWVRKKEAAKNEFAQYYSEQIPPYRAAHRKIISITELRLVKGVTPTVYNALAPYLTALPKETKLNINTLSAPLLKFLNRSIKMEDAKTVVATLAKQPLINKDHDLVRLQLLTADAGSNIKDKFVTISEYFLVETTVSVEKQKLILYTLLERDNKSGKATILWQSRGVI